MISFCSICQQGQKIKLKVCEKCKCTRYCSVSCQKTDWQIHSKLCNRVTVEKLANRFMKAFDHLVLDHHIDHLIALLFWNLKQWKEKCNDHRICIECKMGSNLIRIPRKACLYHAISKILLLVSEKRITLNTHEGVEYFSEKSPQFQVRLYIYDPLLLNIKHPNDFSIGFVFLFKQETTFVYRDFDLSIV